MQESKLRDLIAENIEKLKAGLTLLQKEQYIPKEHGTKSFIDLYAKDTSGHHVLIELKCSDTAARQAIHEVNKYVEGVKEFLGVKDDEIWVIIASTEWRELLVPFSRFAADASFNLEGLNICLHENGRDFIAEPVERLPISRGRFIAPWHLVNWYSDKNSLKRGLTSIRSSYKKKGIEDYLILILSIKDQADPSEQAEAMRLTIKRLAGHDNIDMEHLPSELPVYEYIAYVAMQTLSQEKCLQILARDKDSLAEARELLPDMEEEEALSYLHESIQALEPSPKSDYLRIGYPAKFAEFIDSGYCEINQIERHGIFSRNSLLKNETIVSELRGEDGATGQRLKRTVNLLNRAQITDLKKDVGTCLSENPTWNFHILRIIEEIQNEFPHAEIDVSIFNPSTGVFTIYYSVTREVGVLYVPSYSIIVRDPDPTRMYYGALQENGTALTFPSILKKYYYGDLGSLLLSMSWGGRDVRDADIMEDLGATYRSFRCDIDGDERYFRIWRDERWKPCDRTFGPDLFNEYLQKNEKLVRQIVTRIQPREVGGIVNATSSRAILAHEVDLEFGKRKGLYFHGAPGECDICACSFDDEEYMVDGALKIGNGAWACMCADCFQVFGRGLGWGRGQLYLKNDAGWLQVAGSIEGLDSEED